MRPRAARIHAALSAAAAVILLGGQATAAGDGDQGAQIAAACASCHNPTGRDEGIPAIAGLEERAIVSAMLAFRANEAPSFLMHAVALSLTDEELASVAHYLATHGEGAGAP